MSSFNAFLLVAAGTTVNAVRQMQRGHNAVPTFLGGAAFGVVCVLVNDLSKSSVGTMLAALFLFSSMLTNGVALLDSVNEAIANY